MEAERTSVHMPKGATAWQLPESTDQEKQSEALQAFVSKLENEAKRRVDRKRLVEERWLKDLRQYHGMYDRETWDRLKKEKGSMIFMNLTRSKANRFIGKMWDLMFPTDDKNWGINPTPVPEMADMVEDAQKLSDDARDTMKARERDLKSAESRGNEEQAQQIAAEMEEVDEILTEAQQKADRLHEDFQKAQEKSDLMADEIDDQLKEAGYAARYRDIIEDGAKIGCGVMKGPVLGEKYKQRWSRHTATDKDGKTRSMFMLENDPDEQTPEVQRCDPWGFFPDPDYQNVEDGEGVFERHLMNAKHMRRLSRQPGYDKDAIRRILKHKSKETMPSYLIDLTNLTDQDPNSAKGSYHVWEYTGPVDYEDIEVILTHTENIEMMQMFEDEGIDPLTEMHAKIWFCQGEVLKFALHPLDSNETIYSVFSPEKDETSPFGFGIPYLMRHPQAALNAAWRMLMDNGGLGVGPQIVVNKGAVTPQDGDWTLRARKIWEAQANDLAGANGVQDAFASFDIPSNIQELSALIELSRREMDEIVDIMSNVQESEQGPMARQTATGIALLMNASNVVYRRAVKNADDDVTVPMIRRFYHWNMQFSERDEIKGDYEVDARGSSVLLVRELMAQNLLAIAVAFGDHPRFGDWMKDRAVLEALFRSITIPAKEIVKTEREYRADMRERQENPEINPELALFQAQEESKEKDRQLDRETNQAKIAIAERESASRERVAELNFEADMMALAENMNMQVEELQARISEAREARMSKERIEGAKLDSSERGLAAEVAMAERTGKSSGGAV